MEKLTAIESFQSSLEDVSVILEKLASFYTSTKELLEVLQLAQSNETQLKLLFNLVTQKK